MRALTATLSWAPRRSMPSMISAPSAFRASQLSTFSFRLTVSCTLGLTSISTRESGALAYRQPKKLPPPMTSTRAAATAAAKFCQRRRFFLGGALISTIFSCRRASSRTSRSSSRRSGAASSMARARRASASCSFMSPHAPPDNLSASSAPCGTWRAPWPGACSAGPRSPGASGRSGRGG